MLAKVQSLLGHMPALARGPTRGATSAAAVIHLALQIILHDMQGTCKSADFYRKKALFLGAKMHLQDEMQRVYNSAKAELQARRGAAQPPRSPAAAAPAAPPPTEKLHLR